jgi:hypothetical protein
MDALDDAFADLMKQWYKTAIDAVLEGTDRADIAKRFHTGLAAHDEAYAVLSEVIDSVFPE